MKRTSPRHATRTAVAPPRKRSSPAIPTVVVAAAALIVAAAGFKNDFTYDDIAIIIRDDRLHAVGKWASFFTTPYWPPPAMPDLYRPVTSILLGIQYLAGAGFPLLFRLVSGALYVAVSVAVLQLASRVLPLYVALGLALLFAAQPVHVEAVAPAVGQAELIVSLLAVMAVSLYLKRRLAGEGRLAFGDWTLLLGMYVTASLAKEQGLILPALFIAAESCVPKPESMRDRVRYLWRGYALFALAGLAIVAIRSAVLGGAFTPPLVAEALRGQTFGGRALTMLRIVPEWLRLLVWPVHLRLDYRPQEFVASSGFGLTEALGLGLVIAAAAAAWVARRHGPVITFGILWMAIAFLPVSNLIFPTYILLGERTLFLPSVGFVLAIGGAVSYLLFGIAKAEMPPRRPLGRLVAGAVGILAILGIVRSIIRQQDWRNPRSVAFAGVRDAPRNYYMWQSLGELLFDSREVEDAVLAYTRAVELAPNPWEIRNGFGMRLRLAGRDREAITQFRRSLSENPRQIIPVAQLPAALIAVGEYAEARRIADSVIAVANAPPIMVWLRRVADSAIAIKAPPGSIRVGVGFQP